MITAIYGIESTFLPRPERESTMITAFVVKSHLSAPISALFNQDFPRAICFCYHHPICIPISIFTWIYLATCLSEVAGPLELYHFSISIDHRYIPRSITRSIESLYFIVHRCLMGRSSVYLGGFYNRIQNTSFFCGVDRQLSKNYPQKPYSSISPEGNLNAYTSLRGD
jgi:hypothetical protein